MSSEQKRRRISSEFNAIYGDLSNEDYARRLGISPRTAARIRIGSSVPQKATAQRMSEILDRFRDLASKSEAELQIHLEQVRKANEALQQSIAIEHYPDKEIVARAPNWYLRGSEALHQKKYDVAVAAFEDRLSSSEIALVSQWLRPYAYNKLSLAQRYQGRLLDAVTTARLSIEAALHVGVKPKYLGALRTNLAGVLLRMRDPEGALRECEVALLAYSAHLPAFYIALCSLDALRDGTQLSVWVGRTIQALKAEEMFDQVEMFMERSEADQDLSWARQHESWSLLVDEMRSLLAINAKQIDNEGVVQ